MRILTLPVGPLEANCYIVYHHTLGPTFAIDPGGQPKAILAALRERNLSLSHILLTHAHFDHMLAARAMQRETGAPVFVHSLDLESVRRPRGPFFLPSYSPPDDLRAFDDGDVLEAGGLSVSVRHTPGHTPGSCCLVCQEAIFSGDTLFAGNVGRVDLPGGSPDDMRQTLAKIAAWTGEFTVYPGHGASTSLTHEQAHNPYLQSPFRL